MTSNPSDLKIAVQQGPSWSRRLSITVPADRVERTRGRIAEQIARKARLPGFRAGKLPLRVVEQRFGPSIDQETIDHVVQQA
jgi:trigger factor